MSIITPRLLAIANMIFDGEIVADIGTDHAYLPIYLVKAGKATKIYATDIAKEPLSIAKTNLMNFNVIDDVELILADGIKWIKQKNIKISSCIIAGMGSSSILNILKNDNENIDCYVICSTTDLLLIRKWIKQNKYFIETETLVIDNEIIYEIIKINKFAGYKIKTKLDLFFGPIIRRKENNDLLRQNLYKEEQKITTLMNEIPKKTKNYKQFLKRKKLINKMLKKEKKNVKT